MPSGKHLDHNLIHRALWEMSDRLGRVTINQGELAERFGVNKYTMSRVVTKMLEDERLSQVSNKKNLRGVFRVMNPDVWTEMFMDDDDEEDL